MRLPGPIRWVSRSAALVRWIPVGNFVTVKAANYATDQRLPGSVATFDTATAEEVPTSTSYPGC
jgi:hypothetical protein